MNKDLRSGDQTSQTPDAPVQEPVARQNEFVGVAPPKDEYTDNRRPGEWESRYPPEARREINVEAWCCGGMLVFSLLLGGMFLGLANQSLRVPLEWLVATDPPPILNVDFRFLAIFSVGCVGGATFSIKWLFHATAKGKWHLDRRYWRYLVPLIGGVYACVILTLFDAGFIGGGQSTPSPRPIPIAAALAFLVGYYSDAVSGLLSNIAKAVFGTLEKK